MESTTSTNRIGSKKGGGGERNQCSCGNEFASEMTNTKMMLSFMY